MAAIGWAVAAGAPASAKSAPQVVEPLLAEPMPADQMQERAVTPGEVFLVQRLSAVKSITLGADVRIPFLIGAVSLPKGTQLLLSPQQGGTKALYCGVYAGQVLFGSRNQTRQWVCFEDKDGDGVFESAYKAGVNAGVFLPAFNTIGSPPAVAAPYAPDAEAGRYYFEVGFVYETTGVRSGLGNIVEKIRANGDVAWSDPIDGPVQSRTGYSTWISGRDFPEDITLDRAHFTVVGGDKTKLTVKPVSVASGAVGFITQRCRGFGLNC